MSDWSTLSLRFDVFDPLKGPLKSILQALEVLEAILEALLEIIKIFLLDISNPLQAVVAVIIAAVRTIINQLQATGFSILLVHPDFSRQDYSAIFESVSGAYPSFESKVFSKFYDTSDVFRPTYPEGSAVAMLVLYIGVESPGDLMSQIMALLNFIRHPKLLTGLPAPTDLKVRPALKSDDPTAVAINIAKTFSEMWGASYDKSLVLEWRMPSAPTASSSPNFINQFSTFLNAFRQPSFIVERSVTPTGEAVVIELNTQTTGKGIQNLREKYDSPKASTSAELREENGNVYRNFADSRVDVSGVRLAEGFATGTYRYIDDDPSLVAGQTYFYRVRAYFGSPTDWMTAGVKATDLSNGGFSQDGLQELANSIGSNTSLVKTANNQKFIRYGQDVVMGQPSSIVKGFVPQDVTFYGGFNPYESIHDAVKVGLLLNFEFPPAQSSGGDNDKRIKQKTGWGTLAMAGGQISLLKAGFSDALDLSQSIFFKTTARRIANNSLTAIQSSPKLIELLRGKWDQGGISETVDKVLGPKTGLLDERVPEINWKFIGIFGRGTDADAAKIDNYLSKEDNYQTGVPLEGPFPIELYKDKTKEQIIVDVDARKALADFLRVCLSLNASVSYLSWYSVTIGDLFPAFIPFIFDFEQFLKSLLKAVESAIKEIEAIIETLIQKIQQLEAILKTIIDLLEFLSINIKLSVLGISSDSGSADSLASGLLESTAKPTDSPFGLHSGMVMTFGGPGAGSVAAFEALAFILSFGNT